MKRECIILIMLLVLGAADFLIFVDAPEASPKILSSPIGSTITVPSNDLFNLSFKMSFDEEEKGFFSITFYWDNNESDPNCTNWNFTFINCTAKFVDGEEFSSPLNISIRRDVPSGFPDNYYRYVVSISEVYGETKNGAFYVNVTMLAAGVKNCSYKPHAEGIQNITIVNIRCYETSMAESGPGICSIQVTPQVNFHDVAIANITLESTTVNHGDLLHMNVTVSNLGNVAEEFVLKVFLNETAILTERIFLNASKNMRIQIEYFTGNLKVGSYTAWAEASIVLGETNIDNNVLIDGALEVVAPAEQGGTINRPPVKWPI